MHTNEKNIENQVQLWALAGPAISLASVILLLMKGSSDHHYLAWTLFFGVLLCWKWKLRGLALSLSALVLQVAYHYFAIAPGEQIWDLAMGLAIGLTFTVTALSYEEIEVLIGGLQRESASRLKSVLQLDERLEAVQGRCDASVRALSDALRAHEQEIAAYRRVDTPVVVEELPLPVTHGQRNWSAMYKQLRDQFTEKSHELDLARRELYREREKLLAVEKDIELRLCDVTDSERELQLCIAELEEENEALSREIDGLHALISGK